MLGLGSLASGDAEQRTGDPESRVRVPCALPEQRKPPHSKLLQEGRGPRRRSGSASTLDGDRWRAAPSADSGG